MNFHGRSIPQILLVGSAIGIAFDVIHTYINILSTAHGGIYSGTELLGADFVCFYLAGKAYSAGLSPYDFAILDQLQDDFFSSISLQNSRLVFAYPPFLLPLFSLLSNLSYLKSLSLWTAVSILCVTLSAFLFSPKQNRIPVFIILCIIAVAYTPFSVRCLAGGQLSTLGVIIWSLLIYCIRTNRPFIGGLFLGFGLYKPPLFAVLGIVLLLKRHWSVILGTVTSSVILIFVSMIVIEPIGWDSYLSTILSYRIGAKLLDGREFILSHPVGVYGALMSFIRDSSLGLTYYILTLSICLLIYVRNIPIRFENITDFQLVSLIVSSTLLSVHIVNYDFSIFVVCIFLLTAETFSNKIQNSLVRIISTLFIVTIGILASNPKQDSIILFCLICTLLIGAMAASFLQPSSKMEQYSA